MLRIRKIMGPHHQQLQRNKEWTCFFNLHVLHATILIGLWHLFLNILALSLLAVIMRNPHMMEELENSYDKNGNTYPALPTPLSNVDPDTPTAFRGHSLNYRKQYQSYDMGGLVCTCMIAITMMMIYGAIKGKPSHLLPFFCLQLFDFAITTLTAAGYLCYLQAIHRLIEESHRLPWREKLLELSPEELVIVVLVVFVCIVFLKAYAIGIVWRCYKYLTLRQQSMRTLLPLDIADITGNSLGTARAYSTLLPNYDEAVAAYMKQAPPPSYQVAMSNYAPEEAINAANNLNHDAEGEEDNNNDTSNNNNTVHVNNNTPPMRRSDTMATAHESSDSLMNDVQGEANAEITPPPSYNDIIIEPLASGAQNAAAAAPSGAPSSNIAQGNSNESRA
ncbi:lysosomal-associated transmembrane protein 4A [Stomoxys calcitrans]|uniref:Lysosomal-associated transmembrane protein 4A n=1 Tax=Stomoxys calcitrans TaxID=35570 RepID=A0A1I8P844_STOCA|nr:lysosomal-associated transmembrane protein 4A [Stomoxys calcitrans]